MTRLRMPYEADDGWCWRLNPSTIVACACGRTLPARLLGAMRERPTRAEEATGEADVSAKQPEAGEKARIPPPYVHPGGAGDHQRSATQGAPPPVRLIWGIRDRPTFRALRRGRRARVGPLTVWFVDGNFALPPRVAYAIGRKVGDAVERNRLRRRLRAIVREWAPELAPGAYLIGAAPEAAQLSYGELRVTMRQALEMVGRERRGPSVPSPKRVSR
jgi:ribonuclease P protein component